MCNPQQMRYAIMLLLFISNIQIFILRYFAFTLVPLHVFLELYSFYPTFPCTWTFNVWLIAAAFRSSGQFLCVCTANSLVPSLHKMCTNFNIWPSHTLWVEVHPEVARWEDEAELCVKSGIEAYTTSLVVSVLGREICVN